MSREEARARMIAAWRWFLWAAVVGGSGPELWGTAVALARYEREAGCLAEA